MKDGRVVAVKSYEQRQLVNSRRVSWSGRDASDLSRYMAERFPRLSGRLDVRMKYDQYDEDLNPISASMEFIRYNLNDSTEETRRQLKEEAARFFIDNKPLVAALIRGKVKTVASTVSILFPTVRNPRGIYKLKEVINNKGKTTIGPFGQYKICTDSVY